MSRTIKDSARNRRRDIEVRLEGGTFNVFLSGEIAQAQISERTLGEFLCIRCGYCGSEFDEIIREVRSVGYKKILL